MSCEIIQRQTTFWELRDDDHVVWRIAFFGKKEFFFLTATASSFSIFEQHPLLMDYHHPWSQIFLSGSATAAKDVASSLESAIANQTGPWRAPTHYLNQIGPIEVLESGSGLLLEAPTPIADACKKGLEASRGSLYRSSGTPSAWVACGSCDRSQLRSGRENHCCSSRLTNRCSGP